MTLSAKLAEKNHQKFEDLIQQTLATTSQPGEEIIYWGIAMKQPSAWWRLLTSLSALLTKEYLIVLTNQRLIFLRLATALTLKVKTQQAYIINQVKLVRGPKRRLFGTKFIKLAAPDRTYQFLYVPNVAWNMIDQIVAAIQAQAIPAAPPPSSPIVQAVPTVQNASQAPAPASPYVPPTLPTPPSVIQPTDPNQPQP